MSGEISFALGAATKTLNEIRHMHHQAYARHRAALALEVAALTIGRRPAHPFAKARVVIERHSAGSPDRDGLIGGLKPLLDVLQPFSARSPNGLGIIANDSQDCLRLEASSVRCARGAAKTVVRIVELD